MTHDFRQVERQRGRAVALAGVLMTALCAALVLLGGAGDGAGADLARRWPTYVGLAGLVLLFALSMQRQHARLAALEAELREAAVREATLGARFSELSFLFDISTQVQLRLDLQGMLDLAVQRLLACLEAHQSSIMLLDEASGLLEVRAVAGADAGLVAGAVVRPGEGIAGHVFATGEPLALTPEVMRRRFPAETKRGRQIGSGVCVPMRFRDQAIGVVSVTRANGEPFGDLHVRMLAAFADHFAATVVKTRHHREVLERVRRAA